MLIDQNRNCHEDELPCGESVILVGQHEDDVDDCQQTQSSQSDEVGGNPLGYELEQVGGKWRPQVFVGDTVSAACILEIG